jgi:uracil-DNA glycosylase
LLLVGEAPGYKGCRVSGVPFTSERQILAGAIPRVSAEGRMTKTGLSQTEKTATMCWGVLKEFSIGDCVVMWNAFPWHPHEPGNSYSNRKGKKFTPSERALGAVVLRAVLDLFPGVPVVPVGNEARDTLTALEVSALPSIRHPSNAGKPEFRAGLRERLELLKMC